MNSYGISLTEAARRLDMNHATLLTAMQRRELPIRTQNGRPVTSQGALQDYQIRHQCQRR